MTNSPDPDNCTLSDDEFRLLARVDERTERMDEKIDNVVEKTEDNSDRITTNGKKIKRNTTIVGGWTAGLTAVLMWAADKIARFI